MKFSVVVSSLFLSTAVAFAPSSPKGTVAPSKTSTATASSMNGWSPDENKFSYGLPGAVAPFSEGFDPAGITDRENGETIKTFRESEVTHGRVAMLAVLGFLVTEEPIAFHPLFNAGGKDIGPAIRHLDEVRAVSPFFFDILAISIGAAELRRALIGWQINEGDVGKQLQAQYYPGDIGFDPLGLKPSDPAEFAKMQTKELNNGRLAMLAAAGFIAQELVNGKEIFVNLGLASDKFDPSSLPVQF